jgi:hypothetical protein
VRMVRLSQDICGFSLPAIGYKLGEIRGRLGKVRISMVSVS